MWSLENELSRHGTSLHVSLAWSEPPYKNRGLLPSPQGTRDGMRTSLVYQQPTSPSPRCDLDQSTLSQSPCWDNKNKSQNFQYLQSWGHKRTQEDGSSAHCSYSTKCVPC